MPPNSPSSTGKHPLFPPPPFFSPLIKGGVRGRGGLNSEASPNSPHKCLLGYAPLGSWLPSSSGELINADCNGAANILRKVATQLNLDLTEVGRAVLTLPKRYGLDSLVLSYRKRCGARQKSA